MPGLGIREHLKAGLRLAGMVIKNFYGYDCPNCIPAATMMDALVDNGFGVKRYCIDDASGLGESTYYSVMSTPTIIVEQNGEEIGRFAGKIEWDKLFKLITKGV